MTIFTDRLRSNWPPQEWLIDEGWTAPTIMDDENSSSVFAYGVRGTPFYVVLDGDNRNLGRFSGEVGLGGLADHGPTGQRQPGRLISLRELGSSPGDERVVLPC